MSIKNSRKISSRAVSLVFGVLVLCFALSYWVLAWTEPTSDPPAGNVNAPLNIGATGQSKSGWLAIYESGCSNCSLFVGKSGLNGYSGVIESSGGAWLGSALTSADNGLIVENGRVGIGETNPSYPLEVSGSVYASEFCLSGDMPCIAAWPSGGGGGAGVYGSGDSGYIPKFLTATTVGNSAIFEEGSSNNICIGDCAGASVPFLLTLEKNDPIILLSDPTTNSVESGRVRFIEGTNWYGGYIHYDGSTNIMHIGVHNTGDQNPANDNNAISIMRSSGNVGIGMIPDVKLDVNGNIRLGSGGASYKIMNVADPDVDTDVATKRYVDSKVSSGWAPTDVKASSADHNGNFGGYNGIYNWIQSNGCSGYHVCSLIEVINWAQLGNQSVASVNDTWFASEVTYTTNNSNCSSYTNSSDHAYRILTSASSPWKVRANWQQNACGMNKKVACCK